MRLNSSATVDEKKNEKKKGSSTSVHFKREKVRSSFTGVCNMKSYVIEVKENQIKLKEWILNKMKELLLNLVMKFPTDNISSGGQSYNNTNIQNPTLYND